MNTFQTLLSLVTLILALCVIVQAIQEFVKSALNTKATVMEDAMNKFMGPLLPLEGIKNALEVRGLSITSLEKFRGEEFRHLLAGVTIAPGAAAQLIPAQAAAPVIAGQAAIAGRVLGCAEATIDQTKDHMAAFFESSLASFQKMYTAKNKQISIILSVILVCALNANVVILYNDLSADSVAQQAIQGNAPTLRESVNGSTKDVNGTEPGEQSNTDLGKTYATSRQQIEQVLRSNPVLLRTRKYADDYKASPFQCLFGLFVMAFLVSLGAPFWNDILKSMMGVNNDLNSKGSPTS